jgi:phosphate transport system substrate-binding protein
MLRTIPVIAAIALFSLAIGCGKSGGEPVGKEPTGESEPAKPGGNIDITGAGATFPYPLYSKWMHMYNQKHPNIRINYQSIGSGGGIRQITTGTVDFGASDAPMKDDELAAAPGTLVHIPMTIGAVAVVYNADGIDSGLKLDADTLAGIYLADIKKWNDPKIAALNPDVKLPNKDITCAYRSDGSGTTAVFTDYLAKVSPAWKEKVGAGKSVKFPAGLGAKGNEGVAGQIKTTPGTIGYVELAYAMQTGLPYVVLKNADGEFVAPSLEGISSAAAGAEMPDDYRVSITNAAGPASYPIAAFTYILVYQDMKNATRAKALVDFLWWAIHEGQELGPPLHYAKLPPPLVAEVEATLKTLTSGGKPLLAAD